MTKLSIAEHNRWNLEQLLLHTLPLDFNRYSYFEDITRRKKELLAELFAQNEDEKSSDKERLLVNFDLDLKNGERGERLFNRYIPVGEVQKDFYHLFYDKLEGVKNLKSEKERMYDKIIEELLKEEDIQKRMERLLNSEKDERLDSSEARIAFYDHALKTYKNELKSQMKHLNICSNNRLEEVEYGINENDLKIVLGLPFIVKKYRKSNMGL